MLVKILQYIPSLFNQGQIRLLFVLIPNDALGQYLNALFVFIWIYPFALLRFSLN